MGMGIALKKSIQNNKVVLYSYMIAVVLFVFVSIIRPEFASESHIKTIIIEAAVLGILSLGQTFVILIGGIDFSIQWILCCAAVTMTMAYDKNMPDTQLFVILPIILIACFGVGLLNGFGVAYLKINPMIMTFGMNAVLKGAFMGITGGVPGDYSPEVLTNFVKGSVGSVPNMLFFWVAIIIVVTLLLTKSAYGRRLYAIGNNETAAYYSGVKVKNIKLIAYGICGLTAGLGGMLMTGQYGNSYLGMGDSIMFKTIAAVAIGGTSMIGGSGTYIGTVSGAFIITILTGLLSAILMPPAVQEIIYGLVLLVAIILSMDKSKRKATE